MELKVNVCSHNETKQNVCSHNVTKQQFYHYCWLQVLMLQIQKTWWKEDFGWFNGSYVAVTIPTNNIYDAGPIRSFCVVTETDLEDLLCIHSGIIYIKCIAIFRTFITSLPFHLIFFLAHLSQRWAIAINHSVTVSVVVNI